MKWYRHMLFLGTWFLILSLPVCLLFFAHRRITSDSQRSIEGVLRACTGHAVNNTHHHATLSITYDGLPFAIPANIGVAGTCIHPLHTHDISGVIHIDYPRDYQFTLGDFFNTWGIIFSGRQLGMAKVSDGLIIDMSVNGMKTNAYQDHILRDREQITIAIISKDRLQ